MIHHALEACADAIAILFPVDCAGCGAPDRALCQQCRAMVGHPFLVEQLLDDNTRVVSALRYETIVRAIILGVKEEGRTDVIRALSHPFRAAIECAAQSGDGDRVEVCTVPASKASQRRRGYRPVDVLARAAGFRLSAVLKVSATPEEQKFLDRAQRERNIRDAFLANSSALGRKFVIVDDVVTTGSTLQAAARALRDAGAEVVAAATLGFTARHTGPKSVFSVSARDIHSEGRYGG